MRVALFVPCYIDAFEPAVGIATLALLRRFGLNPDYPFDQTCCGQPLVNTGCHVEPRRPRSYSSETSRVTTTSSSRRAAAHTRSATI